MRGSEPMRNDLAGPVDTDELENNVSPSGDRTTESIEARLRPILPSDLQRYDRQLAMCV